MLNPPEGHPHPITPSWSPFCIYGALHCPPTFPVCEKPPASCTSGLLFPGKPCPLPHFNEKFLTRCSWCAYGGKLLLAHCCGCKEGSRILSSWLLILEKSHKPSAPQFLIYVMGIGNTTGLISNTQAGNLANVRHNRRENTLCFTIQLMLRTESTPAAEDLAFYLKTANWERRWIAEAQMAHRAFHL